MSYWSDTSRENLLLLSQAQDDFQVALKEWEHTGAVIDHLHPIESCQLCNQPNLRYHFEIINRFTQNSFQVGSSCITKFDIIVYDKEGNELQGKAKSKQLKAEIAENQQEMMLEPLRKLWHENKEQRNQIKWCVADFHERKGFSPRDLLYLFKQMNANKIRYVPHIYKVVLRSNEDKTQLFSMIEEDRKFIWASLSAPQKQRYVVGKPAYDKQLAQGQKQAALPQTSTIREMPIRYNERVHKCTITFYNQQGIPIDRFFRGDLIKARRFIEEQLNSYPDCNEADIRLTLTKETIDNYQKK